jgi:Ca2+-dependent lipid-binding protein
MIDPYVKIWLMIAGKKVEKKKTKIYMRDLNPIFNESFTFSVSVDQIRETSLLVTVMDYDKIGRNVIRYKDCFKSTIVQINKFFNTQDLIGRIILSSRSDAAAVAHWNAMLQYPKEAVSQWHTLKDEV